MTTAASAEARPKDPAVYRTRLIIAVIAYYAAWIGFWLFGSPSAVEILEHVQGVLPVSDLASPHPYAHSPMPFADLAGVFSWRECFLQGVDVTARNPCDPIVRGPANYSPLVWHLPLEWIGLHSILAAGIVLDALFLLLLLSMFCPRTRNECLVMVLAMVSPSVFFALERCNLDIVIFLLALGPLLLSQKQRRARIAFYGAIWIGGLLKFYPFALLVMALRERPRRFLVLAGLSIAGISIFVLSYWSYLAHLILPKEDTYGMFGARIFAKGLQLQLGLPPSSRVIVNLLCFTASISSMIVLARKFGKSVNTFGEFDRNSGLLLCGSIFVLACFFSGFNVYYRAIFLLPVLPGLFDLFRYAENRSARRFLGLGLLATIACLYGDMFRLITTAFVRSGILVDAYSAPGRFTAILIFVLKESAWWLEVTLLGGIVIATLGRARTVMHFQSLIAPLRRRIFAAAV